MQKGWTSPIYAFFDYNIAITYIEGRPCVDFICAAMNCKNPKRQHVRQYLDKKDKGSTSNLRRHAIKCFGLDTVRRSQNSTIDAVRKGLAGFLQNGTIPMAFEASASRGVVSYSNQPISKVETQCVDHLQQDKIAD